MITLLTVHAAADLVCKLFNLFTDYCLHANDTVSAGYCNGYRIEGEKIIECNFRRSHQVITLAKGISIQIEPQLLDIDPIYKSS